MYASKREDEMFESCAERKRSAIDALQEIQKAGRRMRRAGNQAGQLAYLLTVYRIYCRWQRSRMSELRAKSLCKIQGVKWRHGTQPVRVLIDVGCKRDVRTKSRWARALDYAFTDETKPKHFLWFLKENGGIAGCVRLNAESSRPYEGDGFGADDDE